MATQIRPFMMTGAVLATAASIVAASPAITPGIASTTTKTLAAANVQLTTFSDIFTIPGSEWSLAAFQGYGGLIGGTTSSTGSFTPNKYAPGCNFNCYAFGLPALAYLAGDALINGNGSGWDTAGGVLENPDLPYQPDSTKPNYNPYKIQPWGVSAINYFYEGGQTYGFGPGVYYLADNAIGSVSPILSTILSVFFAGPSLVTGVWTTALNLTAALLDKLPLVGTYGANSIYAYLGNLYNAATGTYYQSGLSGTLNYLIDQITGNYQAPVPSSGASTTALRAAAATAVAPALGGAAATVALAPARPATAVSGSKTESTPATASTTEDKPDTTPGDTNPADAKSADTKSADTTPTGTKSAETKSADTTPTDTTPTDTKSADSKPADSSSSVGDADGSSTPAATKSSDTPAKTPRQRPVRDAVQKAGKQIANALTGAKAAKSDRSAS